MWDGTQLTSSWAQTPQSACTKKTITKNKCSSIRKSSPKEDNKISFMVRHPSETQPVVKDAHTLSNDAVVQLFLAAT
jgi:hypothetical protein